MYVMLTGTKNPEERQINRSINIVDVPMVNPFHMDQG